MDGLLAVQGMGGCGVRPPALEVAGRALSPEEATRRLQEGAGSQLDPEIVKHFLAILGTATGG